MYRSISSYVSVFSVVIFSEETWLDLLQREKERERVRGGGRSLSLVPVRSGRHSSLNCQLVCVHNILEYETEGKKQNITIIIVSEIIQDTSLIWTLKSDPITSKLRFYYIHVNQLTTLIFWTSKPQIRNITSRHNFSSSLSKGHTYSAKKSIRASFGKNSPSPNISYKICDMCVAMVTRHTNTTIIITRTPRILGYFNLSQYHPN